MQRHLATRVIATGLILCGALAGFGGCATGPITPENWQSVLSAAEDAYALYEQYREAHDADDSDRDSEAHQSLEEQAEHYWRLFEVWRGRLDGIPLSGGQKATRSHRLPAGPMPALH